MGKKKIEKCVSIYLLPFSFVSLVIRCGLKVLSSILTQGTSFHFFCLPQPMIRYTAKFFILLAVK